MTPPVVTPLPTEVVLSPEVAAILAALATVPGLTPTPDNPDVATPGAAWPRWTETRYLGGKLSARPVSTFDVIVVLPAGYGPTTTAAALEIRDTIAKALGHAGPVENAQPVLVTFGDGNDMPAIRYRVTPRIR
jgi:hypothetical protein